MSSRLRDESTAYYSGMKVGGIILCGGMSSRMGQPKAWLPFGGEWMLARVVRIVREAVDPVVVVAAPDQQVPPLPAEVEIVRDEVQGRGPLQGLAAGLAALRDKVDAVFTSSCDVPFLKPAFIRRMIGLLEDNPIAVPRVEGVLHPLAAVYRVAVLPRIIALLESNQLRAAALFDAVPTRIVEAAELADIDPSFQSLRNVNTTEEYAAAVREGREDELFQ
jgi:molybdenum cofactor guanylyltransferase